MGINLKELVGLWLVIAALGLIVGAAFMVGVLAGMFVLGGILLLIGTTLVYVGIAQEQRQLAAKAAETKGIRSAA